VLEACLDASLGDDEERRHLVDAKPLGEVGSLFNVDRVEEEGAVVLAVLEYLREVALHAAGRPICF
jgi:hypothetical protein